MRVGEVAEAEPKAAACHLAWHEGAIPCLHHATHLAQTPIFILGLDFCLKLEVHSCKIVELSTLAAPFPSGFCELFDRGLRLQLQQVHLVSQDSAKDCKRRAGQVLLRKVCILLGLLIVA